MSNSTFLPFGEHSCVDVIGLEDKHPPFSMPLCDDLAFLFDEALMISEANLHSMIDDMSDRHMFLGDRLDVQDVPHHPFLAGMTQIITIRIGAYFCAKPPRHICTILSSSTETLMDPSES